MAQTLTTQQRAALFAQSTRHTMQMLPKETANDTAQTLSFNLPKARLLSRIFLNVKYTVNIKHASKTNIAEDQFTPYKIMRRVMLDLNNGFSPFVIEGSALALYNMLCTNPDKFYPADNVRAVCNHKPFVVSSAGADNTVEFTVQMPTTLNERDPYGMILLQNESTQVTCTIDLVTAISDMFADASGYTFALKNLEIMPMLETFTIPAIKEAFPDLSTLKLVSSKNEVFSGSGSNIVKLNVGTIYRKLILFLTKSDGTPMTADDISGNIELIFNQADIPYSVNPRLLQAKNSYDYGYPLPAGVFVFDFSSQGVPNMGGSRDIIDTQKLTEFWVRFTTQDAGRAQIISECLTSLR